MNKSNLEIIQESIFEFFNVREKIPEGNKEEGQITVFCQLASLNELSDFASNLLKKLKLEEGEVIIEGKVLFSGGDIYIDFDNEWEWTTKLSLKLEDNYKNKKVQIIIREVK